MGIVDELHEEKTFVEFRRKVRAGEVMSMAMQRLLQDLRFTGRLTLVVQNGRILKSGYEEGYFRQHGDTSGMGDDNAQKL